VKRNDLLLQYVYDYNFSMWLWYKIVYFLIKNSNYSQRKEWENRCILNIYVSTPKASDDRCSETGISDAGIVFEHNNCGTFIKHTSPWNEAKELQITGQADGLINDHERVITLRLWTKQYLSHDVWSFVTFPPLKVSLLLQNTVHIFNM